MRPNACLSALRNLRHGDQMFGYETVAAEDDHERFVTAFYRFLEKHPLPADDAAWIIPGHQSGGPNAVFVSRDAADEFRIFLSAFKLHRERPLRTGRFDDLRL